MNKFLILLCVLALVFHLSQASADTAQWKRHCAEVAADPNLFLKKLYHQDNRLSFRNQGGLFNGGVCWWHSRLTRVAQYLAVFDPSAPAMTDDKAYEAVRRLRDGRPVTIYGYKNLSEFSTAHYRQTQQNLEEWQISNGGFGFGFLDGLMGSTSVPANELKSLMDTTYANLIKNRKPIYQVLQLPGVTAHAWLLINMLPTATGYQFSVVDSNYYDIQTWSYSNGDTGFHYSSQPFVSYTTNRGLKEEALLSKRLNDVCSNLQSKGKLVDAPMTIDEELDLLMNPPVQ